MNNAEFIKRYEKREFYALADGVCDILSVWKINKQIRHYRCSNRKKRATIYLNNGTSKCVDYASIVMEKCNIL